MRKRVAVRWGVAAGIGAATFGHLAYWYLPRERGARTPSPEAVEMLADSQARGAAWVAFPHQNLGRLEDFLGDVVAWIELLVAEEAGRDREGERSEASRFPRFGPFAAPPSSELAVTLPSAGVPPHALVRTYPSVARVARAAGRLAGNPWLAGGEVVDGESGSAGRVEWEDDLWRYGRPEGTSSGTAPFRLELPPTEPAPLALLRSASRAGPFPAGTYRLLRDEEGLELRLGNRLEPRPWLAEGPDRPTVVLVERRKPRQLSILLVWPDEGVAPPFPAAAAIVRPGTQRPRLPGEDLLRLAGRRPQREQVEELELSALSTRELERARRLLPELRELLATPEGARLVAVVDPAALLGIARQLSDGFAAFPLAALFGADPARWTELLGPWEECGTVALVVSRRADAARAWLCPPAAPPSR